MVLQKNKFISHLRSVKEMKTEEEKLEDVIAEVDEAFKEEARKSYWNLKQIMKAKNQADIANLTLTEVLTCFKWQKVFADMFDSKKAAEYFYEFGTNISTVRNARKVRVL